MKQSYLNSDAFNLRRYKDNHGRWYELQVNKRPRGKVWKQLMHMNHAASGIRLDELVKECEQLMKGLESRDEV